MSKKLDIKTWAIIILAIIVVLMTIFTNGGGGVELKKLLEEREAQNKELQQRIEERNDSIKKWKESAAYYMIQDSLKGEEIAELELVREQQQKNIDALRKRMSVSTKPIEDATDDKRIEFWKEYFERKGIKQ